MKTYFNENLSRLDRVIRAIVGLTLVIGSSLVLVLSPAMLAALCLLAVYPLMTAMIGWDPVVAAATIIHKRLSAPVFRPLKTS
jgi:hypothetical protein